MGGDLIGLVAVVLTCGIPLALNELHTRGRARDVQTRRVGGAERGRSQVGIAAG